MQIGNSSGCAVTWRGRAGLCVSHGQSSLCMNRPHGPRWMSSTLIDVQLSELICDSGPAFIAERVRMPGSGSYARSRRAQTACAAVCARAVVVGTQGGQACVSMTSATAPKASHMIMKHRIGRQDRQQ